MNLVKDYIVKGYSGVSLSRIPLGLDFRVGSTKGFIKKMKCENGSYKHQGKGVIINHGSQIEKQFTQRN